jgi:predicted dinucleotide-binding enzyme
MPSSGGTMRRSGRLVCSLGHTERDDDEANATVRKIIAGCKFDPVYAGGLMNARYLEPFAMLMVQRVRTQGWGPTGIARRMMRNSALEKN